MNQSAPVAFLVDVDNTLLDNDRIAADLIDYPASKSEALTKAGGIEEKFVGVQDVIAEKLVYVAMKFFGARLEDCVYVTAAIAALAGIV